MSEDPIKAAETRGYSKGYAAGQRRAEREGVERERSIKREAFRQAVFGAALNGVLINGTWRTGEKRWSSIQDHVNGAWKFADEAVKLAVFP